VPGHEEAHAARLRAEGVAVADGRVVPDVEQAGGPGTPNASRARQTRGR